MSLFYITIHYLLDWFQKKKKPVLIAMYLQVSYMYLVIGIVGMPLLPVTSYI